MPKKLESYLVVGLQLTTMAFVFLSGPFFAHQRNLLILQFLGFFLALWAIFEFRKTTFKITPEVDEEAILVVSGPYRFLRHPMYTGLLMICLALIIDFYTPLRLAAVLILFLDLVLKTRMEEKFLARHFRNYKQYSKYTYKIIPFIY